MTNFITQLEPYEIFVFGSNLAGRHEKGAAKTAIKFGAKYGQGIGLSGQTYAIPTKDENIKTLPISKIEQYINDFIKFATENPDYCFLVTEIGCGLAGYKVEQIAPLFEKIKTLNTQNIILPSSFYKHYKD